MILMSIMPIILTMLPIAVYQFVMALRKRKSNFNHYFWTLIMMVYVSMVFSVTEIGSVWYIISKGGLASVFRQAQIYLAPFRSNSTFAQRMNVMNVILFMPLGYLLPYIWKNYRSLFKTASVGFLFSLFIELGQIPTDYRVADVDDLIMNTLGTVLGYVVWKIIGKYFFNKKEENRTKALGKAEPIIYLTLSYFCNFLLYNSRWFI